MLDALAVPFDDAVITAWRERVLGAALQLRWPTPVTVCRRHARGISLAVSAPMDQLFLATEVNEWAFCAALVVADPRRWQSLEADLIVEAARVADMTATPAAGIPPVLDADAALSRFARIQAREAQPALLVLLAIASRQAVSYTLDEDLLTLGSGAGGQTWSRSDPPRDDAVAWQALHDVPTALVTGSNGKTTTVRLIAACLQAQGLTAGYNCTDGVVIGQAPLESGDYSGPVGARRVLRDRRVAAAVLETARGGILRRGLAVSRAHAAVVTNISADHFGEYGIDDLEALADVKLVVAAAVADSGLLILNAEDPLLRRGAGDLARRFGRCPPLGWFAATDTSAALREFQAATVPTCGVEAGHLWLHAGTAGHNLGAVAAMPLALGGVATYNVANLAAAALAAHSLGVPSAIIAAVFARFGAQRDDNPGRMMRFDVGGFTVLVDYAHNPDGLRGFLTVAQHLRTGAGRLGMLLGHAGNRTNEDIQELVRVAASFAPTLIVIKENEAQLRGRAPGEVPQVIRAELLRLGFPETASPLVAEGEIAAARLALRWARPGDVLALPLHASAARRAVVDILAAMEQRDA